MNPIDWKVVIPGAALLVTILGILFSRYISKKRKTGEYDAEREREIKLGKGNEKRYREALKRVLGDIGVMGPGFESIRMPVEETFTSLRISQTHRQWCEGNEDNGTGEGDEKLRKMRDGFRAEEQLHLSPEKVMALAFQKYSVLMIVGDPGSGKTTLLKHYALTCLAKKHRTLGFKKKILPLFFPLRELVFENDVPVSLYHNLESWARRRHLGIPARMFQSWLETRPTLVLLDGLDEIGDAEKRRQVCRWVDNVWTGLDRARFVLTSRPTGYRKSDDVELGCRHLRGEILDFTAKQQEDFLSRWFRAVSLDELPADTGKSGRAAAERDAAHRARTIIAFLKKEENKSVRELACVPMLLQIMAIIWKDRDFIPETRWELYEKSLDYLLEYRDRRRGLMPVLSAEKARFALMPAALWMQETLRADNAPREEIHKIMKKILDTYDEQPDARGFCENLRDRAGVIADYGTDHYIFRHKSFMEYLAALQLVNEVMKRPRRAAKMADYFKDPWWEEALRFFVGKSDAVVFDNLMRRFFESDVSRELDAPQQTLLRLLVKEARQKKIDGLTECLNAEGCTGKQRRYIIDCLKTIGTPAAVEALEDFIDKGRGDDLNVGLARDAVAELSEEYVIEFQPDSMRNPYEDNVEYIRIPGGTYKFSVSKELETVPEIYFCKYPVTNKRYRRFISYLEGGQKDLESIVPLKTFAEDLLEMAKASERYAGYLGTQPGKWKDKFRSPFDDEKRFKGEDQPVVGITWYAARAYCLWLSCLQKREVVYRLPTEVEWEWAAAGREPESSLREYPWEKGKGDPTPKLANYGNEVGATTPVDRYPDGATPEGLMDMAGNVLEWMDNFYLKDKDYRALRGGSWDDRSDDLSCASRCYDDPDGRDVVLGFRVVSVFSPSHTET